MRKIQSIGSDIMCAHVVISAVIRRNVVFSTNGEEFIDLFGPAREVLTELRQGVRRARGTENS